MSGERAKGCWVPLMEYALKHGISLSTLRRYIKADKVDFKLENGRYFLWDDTPEQGSGSASTGLEIQLKESREKLNRAQEEIAELKTLIAFYEESIPKNKNL